MRFGPAGPKLIECGARLGGGGDAQLAQLVVGIDMIDTVLDASLGIDAAASLVAQAMSEPVGHSYFVIPPAPGLILLAGPGQAPTMPGVHNVGFFHRAQQILPPLWSASGRLAVLLSTAPSDADLDRRTAAAVAARDVSIEAMSNADAAAAWTARLARERDGAPAEYDPGNG